MAHETVTKSKRFYCVSMTPDFCKTQVGSSVAVLPYNIKGEFKSAESVSSSVKTHSEPVLLHNKSYIPSITGDERGTLGGIKSQTYLKRAQPMEFSSTKGSNGAQTIQESRLVYMNDKNTVGRIHERKVQGARPRLKILGVEIPTLKEAAQDYKDNISEPLHEFGNKAMDVGGKIGAGSAALGVAGAGVAATGVGLPAAAVMETGAAAGGVTAGAVAGTGFAADSSATMLDNAADYILSGKTPDIMGTLGGMATNAAENFVLKKIPGASGFLKRLFKKKDAPGHTPPPPKKPPESKKGGNDGDGRDGGKTKQEKPKKQDKPASCCPKDKGPGKKKASSNKPVHFGTGEEILYQEDFELGGAIPIVWGRTYRSGSETEDWSMMGERWALPFNSGVSICREGIVYHDDTGRAVRLPYLEIGAEYEHRGEGFTLCRNNEAMFTLAWRNGNVDTFHRGPDDVLPHGYQGVNAMLKPRNPTPTQRYYLTRAVGRSGRGTSIQRFFDAAPDEILLRVLTDDGLQVEAFRGPLLPGEVVSGTQRASPRIGRVEQVLDHETRVCHARYEFELEPDGTDATLPQRWRLVRQSNIAGDARTYAYSHSLLTACTTYSGFSYGLEWVSLAHIRERWAGSTLSDAQLAQRHPITLANSYSARAVRTTTADGRDQVQIEYRDIDTTIVTEADGGKLEYSFDHNWLITEIRRIDATGTPVSLGKREWDKDGKLLADIDAMGNASRYTYDAKGNLLTVTDALGHLTKLAYNAQNQLVAETDALGHTSTMDYDGQGNLIESKDALGRSTRYRYDASGQLIQIVDARGGVKQLHYDASGRLGSYTDCSQLTTRYSYDTRGRLSQVEDAAGQRTTYRYNVTGELSEIARPDGTSEHLAYDAEGRLVEYVDPKGQRTRYAYNGHGLPIERTDANNQTMRYVHDDALRVVELVNANNESYRFTYDAESRLASETGFDGKTTNYEYDRAGYVITSETAGKRTSYARDSLGQLDAKVSVDGSVRYAYDALGRLTAIRNAGADIRYAYDPVGQLIDERTAYALHDVALPDQEVEYDAAFALTHAYDELGNRIHTVLPNGRLVETQRYGSGHWHGTLWNGNSIVDLERDKLHRETERLAGNGNERMRTEKRYDPQSRLTAISLHKGGQVLHKQNYGYDRAGNLSQVDDALRGVTRYTYDPVGQIRSAVHPGLTELFEFDPAGNLLDPGAKDSTPNLQEQPLADAPRPRLPKVTYNLLRQYMNFAYQYDEQGNTIRKSIHRLASANDAGELTFAYDSENRLLHVNRAFSDAGSTTVVHYRYDGFGRRIAKHVEQGAVTFYVWDGDQLCHEVRDEKSVSYLYEPESFVPLAMVESPVDSKEYAAQQTFRAPVSAWRLPDVGDATAHLADWHAHLASIEELKHQERWNARRQQAAETSASDRIYHYSCDRLGTPQRLHADDGTLVWSATYRTWGRVLFADRALVAQPLRFQGQYEDAETGLYYNRYRYYDPDSARYITQDPIGLAGGTNLYRYVDSPTTYVDPLGLFATAAYVYGVGNRIESATATITSSDLNTGSNTNATSRKWARKLGCPLDDAGHVVGNQLGGRGGKKYVFPQALGKNRGEFAQWESDIAALVRQGATAYLDIRLIYTGASTRPDKIAYSYTINGHTESRIFDNPRNCP